MTVCIKSEHVVPNTSGTRFEIGAAKDEDSVWVWIRKSGKGGPEEELAIELVPDDLATFVDHLLGFLPKN